MIHADEGRLQAHLDGEIPETDRIALESHLAVCGACRDTQHELRHASRLLHAALVTSDEVAGTMTALEGFAARRHALDGAPAAANGAAPRDAARQRPARPRTRQRTKFGRPLRVARGGILKAAALALVLAGAASAAMPESPVRWLIEAVRDRLGDETAPASPAPAPEVVAPAPPGPASQERIEPAYRPAPADGALLIRLRSVGEDALIHVRVVDDTRATIRPTAQSGVEVESDTGRGWIELRNLGNGDIFVDVPRSANRLTVEVDGHTYFRKQGDQTSSPGPVVASEPDEYVFRAYP